MDIKIVLIMGVSSCGKTTIGEKLAAHLNWPFYDGDTFHRPEFKEKMRRGEALTDSDRLPWLQTIRAKIDEHISLNKPAVFTCSALKERYRQVLLEGVPDAVLVHLSGSKDKLRERASSRVHEYMPASLLDSQFDTLEAPNDAITISVEGSLEQTLASLYKALNIA